MLSEFSIPLWIRLSNSIPLPSALVAVVLFAVPKWRRVTFPPWTLLALVPLLLIHAREILFGFAFLYAVLADLDSFDWIGSAVLAGSIFLLFINIPAFVLWALVFGRTWKRWQSRVAERTQVRRRAA